MAYAILQRSLVPAVRNVVASPRVKAVLSRSKSIRATQSMDAHVGAGSGGRIGGWNVRQPPQDIPFAVKGVKFAVAVPDLSVAAERYRTAVGAQVSEPVDYVDEMVTKVFVQLPTVSLELLHPLSQDSPVAEYLRRNPRGGFHHLSLAVDDLHSAAEYLCELGLGTLAADNKNLRTGLSGMFLEPNDTMGMLVELQQNNRYRAREDSRGNSKL